MNRSEINNAIKESISFFESMNFYLPNWALWKPQDWIGKRKEAKEILNCGLGWDITDFGSGDFQKIGLINFNLRNGTADKEIKPYCEKIIIVKENQVTPNHTHRNKIEDIINRGGGNLVIEIYRYDKHMKPTDESTEVSIDGLPRNVPVGGNVVLTPGESICLRPGMFHLFYGQEGKGTVLVGEVSSVNDDTRDNVFVGGNPRFPDVAEDEEPIHLLVNDYNNYL